MNCNNCGSIINPGDTVCRNCGAPVGGNVSPGIPSNNAGGMFDIPNDNNVVNQNNTPMNQGMPNNMTAPNQGLPNMNNQMMSGPMEQNFNNTIPQQNGMPMNQEMPNNMNVPNQGLRNMNNQMMPGPMEQNFNNTIPQQNGMPMNQGMSNNMNVPNQDIPNLNNQMMNGQMNQNFNNTIQPEPNNVYMNEKKEKKKISPVLIFLIIVLIGVLAYAGPYWYKEWFGNKEKNASTDNVIEDENTIENNNTSLELGNYTFSEVPGFTSTLDGNKVIINNDDYIFVLVPTNTKYQDLKDNLDDIKTVISNDGITIEDSDNNVKDYNGKEYLVFNGKYNDMDINYIYTSIDDNNLLQGIIFKSDTTNNFDNSYNYLNTIISNINLIETNDTEATYSTDNLGIGTIDLNKINNIFNQDNENNIADAETENEDTEDTE